VALPRVDETVATFPARANLPELTPQTRALVARAEARHLALQADNQILRDRYEEVMRWINPPWDSFSRRTDPRPDEASALRDGQSKIHIDHTNQVVDRWAVLQAGAPFGFRVAPPFVSPPVDLAQEPTDLEAQLNNRKLYDIERALAQDLATRMENQTQIWIEANDLDRMMLWTAWAKEAFGKAIVRTGWDDIDKIPTAELMENPSTCFYGWSRRYGRRKLQWFAVIEEIDPTEANRRWDLGMPLDEVGALDVASWVGTMDRGDMDNRDEQNASTNRFITVMEYHELKPDGTGTIQALIVGGRVVEYGEFPWKRLPFHVFENQHIPTYMHGKSVAESEIPINEALDDLLARQHEVVEFESGPRYIGLNMANTADEVDVPAPFELLPLQEGEDIRQLDTRVDFFPSELHSNQLYEAGHRSTGLTPIAWGMSPNAQTSGRAMSAEWRAVELPLTGRLINMGPEVKAMMECWWDYAEAYSAAIRDLSTYKPSDSPEKKSYRRFKIIWVPLDIRDKTERTLDVIQRVQGGLLDPETAIEELGYENGDEIMARIKAYYVDPIYNPLRYQQYLTLQQIELQIQAQQLQNQQAQAQAQGGGGGAPGGPPAPGDAQQQGANAAGQAAQGPSGPVTESNNQAGGVPGGGGAGLPVQTSVMSQTPLQGGIGDRAIVQTGGGAPAPASGQQPQ